MLTGSDLLMELRECRRLGALQRASENRVVRVARPEAKIKVSVPVTQVGDCPGLGNNHKTGRRGRPPKSCNKCS